jgi:hypothetical protein
VKKNGPIFAVLAIVLAWFGISNLPKNQSGGTITSEPESRAKLQEKGSTNSSRTNIIQAAPACKEIRKRLEPVVGEVALSDRALPQSCFLDKEKESTESKKKESTNKNCNALNVADVDFVIATVPNPISTHLVLTFDRITEIIQQAAQDNGYSYESSWLPWNESKEYLRPPDQLSASELEELQEQQPGILVFRNPIRRIGTNDGEGGLVVFVVSETPTGGVNSDEFENALAWMVQMGKGCGEVKILGPNFSGSLPSLDRALYQGKSEIAPGVSRFTIFSGSVSGEDSYQWFRSRLNDKHLGSFTTALESDSLQLKRFCQYIKQQGYLSDRVAFLSEDETAFGMAFGTASRDSGKCDPCQGATNLSYPRDISTLRSAYEQQSIFSAGNASRGTNTGSTTLRSELTEPASGELDTVRSYGGHLTPLAQESVLLAISDVLKAKKIQFVVIRSTNSLDQIFLGQFLRRTVPAARVVFDGADLLFSRGSEGSSLRGVMLLSTYPLLIWQQLWTSSSYAGESWWHRHTSSPVAKAETYRVFGADFVEGAYIAARELFPDVKADPKVPIANYGPPGWARSTEQDEASKRPATWLTVIGHRQFWPLAVLNSYTLDDKGRNGSSILPASSTLNDSRIQLEGDSAPMRQFPLQFGILMLFCVAWSVAHLLFCRHGSMSPMPSKFRHACFSPVPKWQHPALIAVGSVVIVSVAIILSVIYGPTGSELVRWKPHVAFLILAIVICACAGCASNYKLSGIKDSAVTKWQRKALVGSVLYLVLFDLTQLAIVHHLDKTNSIPAFWRSIYFLSGVSPLLPQLFLMAGLYCWFWFSLRGLSLFNDDRPLLPNSGDLLLANKKSMPMFARETTQEQMEEAAKPIEESYLQHAVLIFALVVLVFASLLWGYRSLSSLGEMRFSYFILFWIAFCITLILAETSQAWWTWSRLRVLLNHINLLPLRRTLRALEGMSWQSVWAMSGRVLAQRYCLISRQLEFLRHLRNQVALWVPGDQDQIIVKYTLLTKIDDFQESARKEFTDWYTKLMDNKSGATTLKPLQDVQASLASLAGYVFVKILIPSWQNEKDSLIVDRAQDKGDTHTQGPGISPELPAHVIAAEEFFVLPYIGFIQNILGRIRSIVLGILCLFVTTTLAVSSYPFEPLPVLGGIFLSVFTITGTTIVLIYAGMHRDATLSYITDTSPGELGGEFWRELITYGIGPLIGLLTTLFPSITDFLVSWIQPSVDVIK